MLLRSAIAAALMITTVGAARPAFAQSQTAQFAAAEAVALARSNIARGNLEAALTPLERALLLVPEADAVRLLYADTLYRLGDKEGAEREAALVAGRTEGAERAAAASLLKRARDESKSVRTRGTLYAGVLASSDPTRGLAPSDSDVAAVGGLAIRTEVDIPGAGGGYVFGQALVRGEAGHDFEPIDGVAGDVAFGVNLPFGDLEVIPSLFATTGLLDSGTRSERWGGEIDFIYAVTRNTDVFLGVSGSMVDQARSVALDASGDRYGGEVGVAANIGFGLGASVAVGAAEFDADRTGLSYDEISLSVDLTLDLPRGVTAIGSADLRAIDFTAIDREDEDADLYLGLRAPLNVGGALEGFGVQAGVRHRSRRSTLAALDGEDTALEVLLTRDFGF